jgi:P27 family predicted phage terminase small subunit
MKGGVKMGRPRKVVSMSTGKTSKASKVARMESEKALKVNTNELRAPEWLPDLAAVEFDRVVDNANQVGMLDNLDLSILAIYADNYCRYIEASKQLAKKGPVTKAKSGYQMPSPWVSILNQSAKNIFTCSAKLGLAVTDRLKLIVPVKEEKEVNKFIKFLGNGSNGR